MSCSRVSSSGLVGAVLGRFSYLKISANPKVTVNRFSPNVALSSRALSIGSCVCTYESLHKKPEKHPFPDPKRWPLYNEVVREPEAPDSLERRRATFHYVRDNIKYSAKKMWYICSLIRGLTVDEAVKQLSFINSKGAQLAKEMLLEAQQQAVAEHGFEFKSNMFVAECFTGKGLVVKGIRKHAFYRMGTVRYFHCHFFLKLVEGSPPRPFYPEMNPTTGQGKLQKYVDELNEREIEHTI